MCIRDIYIVVPIFLMLRDGDVALKSIFGSGSLLNNLFVQMCIRDRS